MTITSNYPQFAAMQALQNVSRRLLASQEARRLASVANHESDEDEEVMIAASAVEAGDETEHETKVGWESVENDGDGETESGPDEQNKKRENSNEQGFALTFQGHLDILA